MTIKKQKLKKCIQHVGKVDECLGKVLSNARLAFKETCAALDEWSKNGSKVAKNGPEGQAVLAQGGYVPANQRLPNRAHALPLVFVDPAVVLDEDAKWKKLYAEIVLGAGR